jgi:hypothetical protein
MSKPEYVRIEASQVPDWVRFDTPQANQGQIVLVSYGGHRDERSEYDPDQATGSRLAAQTRPQHLQRLMRHQDINTTLKFYTDLDDGLQAAIDSA